MRALITGGKGFVGQWLSAHLKDRGDDVAIIDLETDVADGAAVRRVMSDVRPDAVYHLAAMTHVGDSWEHPSQVLRVNVLGTAEILAAARAIPELPRVLVVSSAEVYGVVGTDQLPLDEHTATLPASPYAASKLAAEAVALQAWRGYGQPVMVVRPFNHIGPGQSPNFFVPALAKRIVEARRAGACTGPSGRRAQTAGRRNAAPGDDGMVAGHPPRDNARRCPRLVGGGLTASVVCGDAVVRLRRSCVGGSGSAPRGPARGPWWSAG